MSRSLAKINRLGVLSREIRNDYESLQQLLERTRQNCNEVVAETILLGTKLAEAKKLVGHGNWCEWLAKSCPDISEKTAQNYMRLSKAQHVADLKTHNSLRQAYLAVGIIPMGEESAAMPVVDVSPPAKQIKSAIGNDNANSTHPIVEATVVESAVPGSEAPTVARIKILAETPAAQVKGKVGDLMQCLKPLDKPCRRKVAIHLKPLVIFYHRFGK
jgi:hypothetical protein